MEVRALKAEAQLAATEERLAATEAQLAEMRSRFAHQPAAANGAMEAGGVVAGIEGGEGVCERGGVRDQGGASPAGQHPGGVLVGWGAKTHEEPLDAGEGRGGQPTYGNGSTGGGMAAGVQHGDEPFDGNGANTRHIP